MRGYKAQALLIAILIYVALLVVIFVMILTEPTTLPKAKNFTDKQSDVIEVSLGSPSKSVSHYKQKHNKKSKAQKKKESKPKPKDKPKKIRNVKPKESVKKSPKKVEKKVTKKPPKAHKKPTKPNTHKLFGAVKDIKADSKESSNKPKGNRGKSPSKEDKMRGEKNAYFAKVQKTLMGWPAQNNFAGEMIVVELKIYSTGLFDYKILSRSLNPEFNIALKNYLEQLRSIGFGSHSNPKPYKIVVKFKAKN